MSALSESVQVVITSNTKTVAPQNFGLMLICGSNVNSALRTISVSSLASALPYLCGGTASQEYIKLAAAFAQQNAPAIVKLGTMANSGVTTATDNAGTFTSGSISASFYLNGSGTAVAVTTSWGTDKDTTLTAFAAALQVAIRAAIGSDTTSTVVYSSGSHTIVITPKSTNRVSIQITPAAGATDTLTISSHQLTKTEASYSAALSSIQLSDDVWYQLVIASSVIADVKSAAGWVEASSSSPKFFVTASSDATIINTAPASDSSVSGSIAAQLKGLGYTRSADFYSGTAGTDSVVATQAVDAATLALIAAYAPGTYNVAYKGPIGITADILSAQQEAYSRGIYSNGSFAAGKECNTLETLAGQNIIRWGRTAAGGWIDQVIFTDAVVSDLQTAVYSLFVNTLKVPRDINGYAMIESAIESVLKGYQSIGAITPYAKDSNDNQIGGFLITMPSLASASSADKTGRVLNGASFVLWYAAPINSVKISGTIAL